MTERIAAQSLWLAGLWLICLAAAGPCLSAVPLVFKGDHKYPPYEYLDTDGRPAGFNIDITRAVAREMGMEVRITLGPWAKVRSELETGRIDGLMGMFNTPERDLLVDFSIPHFIASYAVFVRKGSDIKSISDARDRAVIVQEGDLGHDYVRENRISKHLVMGNSLEEVLASLASGRGDCAVASRLQGLALIRNTGLEDLIAVGGPIIQRKYSLAVTEGNSSLLATLNEGLSIIKTSGEYDRIYDRWFGIYDTERNVVDSVLHYIIIVTVPFLVLAVVFFVWSWTLKRRVKQKTRELADANAALEIHRNTLEQQVAERTLALEKEKANAEQANLAKSEFIANMSHEIRTPMNAILGFTEILSRELGGNKLNTHVRTIHNCGTTLLGLINDILDLSKIEAGELRLEKGPVHPAELVYGMESVFGPAIAEKGLSLEIRVQEDLPVLMMDDIRMRQILTNLVGNAVKFTREGEIRLALEAAWSGRPRRPGLDLVLTVADTGIGIPKDQQAEIFKSFKQRTGQKISEFGGTGLGLSITRKLVFLMGGDISVESSEGKGAVFTVTLPGMETAPAKNGLRRGAGVPDLSRLRFENRTILVVDDIDFNRKLLLLHLAPYGFSLMDAENGHQALEAIRTCRPDLILLDMKMPVMNGYEVLEALARDPETDAIPVIAVTASALADEERQISRLCDGYLKKPVSRADLVTALLPFIPHTLAAEEPGEHDVSSPGPASIPDAVKPFLKTEAEGVADLLGRMNLEDIEAFCFRLKDQGRRHGCALLSEWGEDIHRAAQTFDTTQIIRAVDRFLDQSGRMAGGR